MLIPDVIVKSNRITFLNSELKETPVVGEQIIVKENYFSDINSQPVSSSNFSSEEIRRTATFSGDVGRIVSVLPSISNENEGNHLIVRGGSTIENKFYIDNFEVPNINHLPIMGTTGGFYSVPNIDFIERVDLYSGGFDANNGNSLSSVMQINLREGNRKENDYQLDISARHNFSDIILLLLENESDQNTKFNDIQGKVVYDISPKIKLNILDIFSTDFLGETRNYSINNNLRWYGSFKVYQNILGLNWKFLWNEYSYSVATISHIYRKEKVGLFTTLNSAERIKLNNPDNIFQFRNNNFFIINPEHKFELGMELKQNLRDINSYYASGLDLFGNVK
ncbi:MAG: Plug domain-containing protein, partial [bacterium]